MSNELKLDRLISITTDGFNKVEQQDREINLIKSDVTDVKKDVKRLVKVIEENEKGPLTERVLLLEKQNEGLEQDINNLEKRLDSNKKMYITIFVGSIIAIVTSVSEFFFSRLVK